VIESNAANSPQSVPLQGSGAKGSPL
jgi:hypothetical protein